MQTPTPSLRSLTEHLSRNELREVLHPFCWVPLYLLVLGITIVETAQLFTPFIFFEHHAYQDLIEGLLHHEGLLHPEGLGGLMDPRIREIRFIARISFRSWVDDPRENVERFIDLVLGYLTDFVLQGTTKPIIRSYRRPEAPNNFMPPRTGYSISYHGITSVFYPRIAVATTDGAQLITVVAPLDEGGNPNCQLVGFLLGVAQKHFRESPSSFVCALTLIRLTDGFVVYFAKAWVTRRFLESIESGMADGVDGLRVHISDAFDLSVVTERIRFVDTLTDLYQTAHDNAGPMPPLHALELE